MDPNNPIFGDDGDPADHFVPEDEDSPQASPGPLHSSDQNQENSNAELPDNETSVHNSREHASGIHPSSHPDLDSVCTTLQNIHHLDAEHSKIAREASMVCFLMISGDLAFNRPIASFIADV